MIFTQLQHKSYLPFYINFTIYFIAALLFSYSVNISMIDDGLRHIAFASNIEIMKNWGEVFPKSLFNEYDPWHNWHYLITIFLKIFSYEKVHIAFNTLILFTLMLLIDAHLRREINYDFKTLIYIIVFLIVFLLPSRYINMRPDSLSGLYVIFVLLLKNKFWPVFIITLIYGPFYYVYYIYSAFLGLTFLIQKKFRLFFGIFLASIFVLIYYYLNDGDNFVKVIKYVLNDQELRNGLNVGESSPLFGFLVNINTKILALIFFIVISLFLYYKYNFLKNRTLELFLLLSSVLWINQVRFYGLFFPIIAIIILSYMIKSDKKKIFYSIRKYLVIMKKYVTYSSKIKLFYFIAIPYSIFMLSYKFSFLSFDKEILKSKSLFQRTEFNNKIILFNQMSLDKYSALYSNPSLHIIPSCGIGWFDDTNKEMKDLYIKMQKKDGLTEEELYKFIKYVNADYYIHYLENENQVLNFKKLEELGIVPKEIYNNRIIFTINKDK